MRYKLITKGPAWFEDLHAQDKREQVPLIEVERLMNVAEYSQHEITKLQEEITRLSHTRNVNRRSLDNYISATRKDRDLLVKKNGEIRTLRSNNAKLESELASLKSTLLTRI